MSELENLKSTREMCDAILDTLSEEDMLQVFQYLLDLQQFNTEKKAYVPPVHEPPQPVSMKIERTYIKPPSIVIDDEDDE